MTEHRYTNRLAGEASPYLLQHAHNPVDWYPWGLEALARSRDEDRPIFLSIGYAACHWCHVMERESFEDPQTAALLNRDFVAIKVDREERPDLDEVYMAAVQAMTGSGGWPMSVFLTPTLEPFFGGTYFPPADRHGLPGFPRVLAAVADAYRNRRDEINAQGRQLAAHLRAQMEVAPSHGEVDRSQLEAAARGLLASFDAVNGGFGRAPKFPAPMTLEFLLRLWRRDGDPAMLRAVTVTLDRMAAGGIRDQLGGGFARYSTDDRWLVPHFEQMLYDNALLAHAYLEAFRATGEARYREVAAATIDFMLRELRTEDGGFASALDADSEGEEGRFATWEAGEFHAALAATGIDGEERAMLAAHWGVTGEGNFEGRNVLHRSAVDAAPDLVRRGTDALLAARAARPRPARDEKQLAAWNGLALRALAHATLVIGQDRYQAATEELVGFVRRKLLRGPDRVWRAVRGERATVPGFAEDYACLADGLLAAYAALGDLSLLELARALMERAVADFWDASSGMFRDAGAEHDGAIATPRSVIDSATPSSNAVAADVLLRLALLTGDEDADRRARSVLGAVAPAFARQPSAFGRMLAAADRALGEPIDAVVVGVPSDPLAVALRRAAVASYAPDLVVAPLVPGHAAGDWPLFAGKALRGRRATAYVCRGYACDEPTQDPGRVVAQVAAAQSAAQSATGTKVSRT